MPDLGSLRRGGKEATGRVKPGAYKFGTADS